MYVNFSYVGKWNFYIVMIVCFSCLPNASIVKDFRPDSVMFKALRKESILKREHA